MFLVGNLRSLSSAGYLKRWQSSPLAGGTIRY